MTAKVVLLVAVCEEGPAAAGAPIEAAVGAAIVLSDMAAI
jgi:hypothetical protein